jgi:hypothetical protein
MQYRFEGCEHILDDVFDYALKKGLPIMLVDDELQQAYLSHKSAYDAISEVDIDVYDLRRRGLDVHVIMHVESRLEQLAGEKDGKK